MAKHTHDLALLGVALLATGGATLGAGSGLPGHLLWTAVAWAAAVACLAVAHARYAHPHPR